MSAKYNQYLREHIDNVQKAFKWLETNLPELVGPEHNFVNIIEHDLSKYTSAEYMAYDLYFYSDVKADWIVERFNKAWLHHIHHNPHHWQHWVLIEDDGDEKFKALEMPYNYIIEMICDWWSFSWKKGDLNEIFEWYDKHEHRMKLGRYTRRTVEDILAEIKFKLKEVTPDNATI